MDGIVRSMKVSTADVISVLHLDILGQVKKGHHGRAFRNWSFSFNSHHRPWPNPSRRSKFRYQPHITLPNKKIRTREEKKKGKRHNTSYVDHGNTQVSDAGGIVFASTRFARFLKANERPICNRLIQCNHTSDCWGIHYAKVTLVTCPVSQFDKRNGHYPIAVDVFHVAVSIQCRVKNLCASLFYWGTQWSIAPVFVKSDSGYAIAITGHVNVRGCTEA
ncbi:unnamed protein product [Larinioides sclopetarius]|uniref:Uncharacterized protein n=1 Tax=Larinioides sclopetarius TaxID=280406 RepID=A0AAV2BYF6_9ARAC